MYIKDYYAAVRSKELAIHSHMSKHKKLKLLNEIWDWANKMRFIAQYHSCKSKMHIFKYLFCNFLWESQSGEVTEGVRGRVHENSWLYSQVLEARDTTCHTGPCGKMPVWSRGRRREQGRARGLYWGFPGKGKAVQGEQLRTGLVWIISVGSKL